MKWLMGAAMVALLLGPGALAFRSRTAGTSGTRGGGEATGTRPWLGRAAAIALGVLWVAAFIAVVRAV